MKRYLEEIPIVDFFGDTIAWYSNRDVDDGNAVYYSVDTGNRIPNSAQVAICQSTYYMSDGTVSPGLCYLTPVVDLACRKASLTKGRKVFIYAYELLHVGQLHRIWMPPVPSGISCIKGPNYLSDLFGNPVESIFPIKCEVSGMIKKAVKPLIEIIYLDGTRKRIFDIWSGEELDVKPQ